MIAVLGVLLGLLNCTQTESTGRGDELGRANDLIDRRQYSEAVYILGERLKRDPGDQRARILLASAYAGRAGLTMSSFSVFAREIDKWKMIDELLPGGDDSAWIQQVAKISFRLQIALRAFDALPTFQHPEAIKDLVEAARVLEGGGRLSGGSSIFRALIRIVVFKNDLQVRLRPNVPIACRIAPADLNQWLGSVVGEVVKIVDDVAYGLADEGARTRTLKLETDLKANLESLTRAPDFLAQDPGTVAWPALLKKVYGGCGV